MGKYDYWKQGLAMRIVVIIWLAILAFVMLRPHFEYLRYGKSDSYMHHNYRHFKR